MSSKIYIFLFSIHVSYENKHLIENKRITYTIKRNNKRPHCVTYIWVVCEIEPRFYVVEMVNIREIESQ